MSNFNLTQYKKQSNSVDVMQVPMLPYIAVENTAFAATTQSAILSDETNLVRIILDANGFMDYGADPIALTSEVRLIADREYWFEVELESNKRFAFINA